MKKIISAVLIAIIIICSISLEFSAVTYTKNHISNAYSELYLNSNNAETENNNGPNWFAGVLTDNGFIPSTEIAQWATCNVYKTTSDYFLGVNDVAYIYDNTIGQGKWAYNIRLNGKENVKGALRYVVTNDGNLTFNSENLFAYISGIANSQVNFAIYKNCNELVYGVKTFTHTNSAGTGGQTSVEVFEGELNLGYAEIGDTFELAVWGSGDVYTNDTNNTSCYMSLYNPTMNLEYEVVEEEPEINYLTEDLIVLRRLLLGIDKETDKIYNLNGDNKVDITDLIRLKKFLAGSGDISYLSNTVATGFVDEFKDLVVTTPNFEISNVVEGESISFNPMFTNGMVLQRDRTLKIYGECDVDGAIAVTINNKSFYGNCQNGKWEVYIGSLEVGGPYDLVVQNATSKKTLTDVLVGEVYLVSGQSNMAWTLSMLNANIDFESLLNDKIRVFTTSTNAQQAPIENVLSTGWKKGVLNQNNDKNWVVGVLTDDGFVPTTSISRRNKHSVFITKEEDFAGENKDVVHLYDTVIGRNVYAYNMRLCGKNETKGSLQYKVTTAGNITFSSDNLSAYISGITNSKVNFAIYKNESELVYGVKTFTHTNAAGTSGQTHVNVFDGEINLGYAEIGDTFELAVWGSGEQYLNDTANTSCYMSLCNPTITVNSGSVSNTNASAVLYRIANEEPMASIGDFTATGYYFAYEMQKRLGIPVGIVNSSVGGTIISCWLPEDVSTSVSTAYQSGTTAANTPSLYYNGMIAPVLNYQFAGAVWYQGEDQPNDYEALLQTLVSSWRKNFNQKYMTFSIVQLPRCGNRDAEGWYKIRQQQKAVALKDKNVTYSVNIDLGESNNIHPADKQPLAQRLAMATLSEFYGINGTHRSPCVVSAESLSGNRVAVKFNNTGLGLEFRGYNSGFEVSSDGINYYDASAQITTEDTVELYSASVVNPKYVRYAYSAFPTIYLYNSNGYPCEQFVLAI